MKTRGWQPCLGEVEKLLAAEGVMRTIATTLLLKLAGRFSRAAAPLSDFAIA